jgi:hypothetical protein
MWIISCLYPNGVRRNIDRHSIRAEAENHAAKLRRALGQKFQITVRFEEQVS